MTQLMTPAGQHRADPPPQRRAPGRPSTPRRTRGRQLRPRPLQATPDLAGLDIVTLVSWQIAVTLAVYALTRPMSVGTAALLLAAAVVLIAGGVRHNGRAPAGWLRVAVAFTLRRRSGGSRSTAGPLARILPDVGPPEEFVDRSGGRYGILPTANGWVVIAAVETAYEAALMPTQATWLSLSGLRDALHDHDVRLVTVQLLAQNINGTGLLAPPRMGQRAGRGAPVAYRRAVWVTLTLDPRRCPEAVTARGGGASGAHRALAAVAARLAVRLRPQGVRLRFLDVDEARSVIAVTGGVTGGRAALTERWRHVDLGGLHHRCLRVRSWPTGTDAAVLVDQLLTAVPGTAVTASLVLADLPESTRAVLRLTTLPGRDPAAGEAELRRVARELRADLSRCDGEQLAGLRATLPLGGL